MALRTPRKALDWAAVRNRMTAALEATEALLNPSPERRRQILENRAAAFDLPDEPKRDREASMGTVSFVLSGNRFALETRYVSGVVSVGHITPLPRTPDHVLGVYELRGHLLPVFDLRAPLGISAGAPDPVRWAIVCGETQPEFMIAVDSISDVAERPAGSPAGANAEAAWVSRIAADGTMVLDGAALLNDRRLFLDDRQGVEFARGEGKP